ncbi:hypothetical protein RAS2_23890 [Phycisphaerae bacterium RAS2]|nr:hypothetical protein RAS2_23890 [Phycisphaerae bacterium RAS2]
MLLFGLAASTGCGRMDWNWDRSWWKEPRRVVRPSTPPAPQPQGEQASQQREPSTPTGTALPALADPRGAEPPPQVQQRRDQARTQGLGAQRAYYQLYFESGADVAADDARGEYTCRVVGASARAAASAVEMLYVPAGRSGSEQSCYLLYEDRRELDAAVRAAQELEAVWNLPAGAPGGMSGARMFGAAVSSMLRVLELGPVAPAETVDSCLRQLTSASSSVECDASQRWACDVWRARVLADQRYDYAGSRDACEAALGRAESASLERMTALWWLADAHLMGGRTDAASSAWESILREFGEIGEQTQIVRRAELNLDKFSKR